MRRSGFTLIAGIAMVLGTGLANATVAGFTAGVYRTRPPASRVQYLDLGFTASKTQVTGIRFYLRVPERNCTNDRGYFSTEESYPRLAAAIKRKTGTFSLTKATGPGAGTLSQKLTISGRMKGRSGSGTLRSKVLFSSGVACDTKNLRWRVQRLG